MAVEVACCPTSPTHFGGESAEIETTNPGNQKFYATLSFLRNEERKQMAFIQVKPVKTCSWCYINVTLNK